MDYVFPFTLDSVPRLSKGDYPQDSGCDILAESESVVAVGNATLIYAERGHTKWTTPPDTPYSVKLRLDKPVIRNGVSYPLVFMTHLSQTTTKINGTKIDKGEYVGTTGLGNKVPHLHITFYTEDHGRWIGKAPDDYKSDEVMLWDEWLPAQVKEANKPPTIKEDIELDIQGNPLPAPRHVLLGDTGTRNGKKGKVTLVTAAQQENANASQVDITIFGALPGNDPEPNTFKVVKARPFARAIDNKINDRFVIILESRNGNPFFAWREQTF